MKFPWFDPWRVSPPAIWGKLPHHADFVRSGVRHGELEAWASWLDGLDGPRHGAQADAATKALALPVAFVLPPGVLAFAPRRFVLGVIAPSFDRVGRRHPLVVYQRAHPRWVQRHFEAQLRQPCDWQFWLARAMARHVHPEGPAHLAAMKSTVKAVWRAQAALSNTARRDGDIAPQAQQAGWLDRWAGPVRGDDPGARLHGVRYLPWADWPQCLQGTHADSAFWQQDAQGRFVGASHRLQSLWSGAS